MSIRSFVVLVLSTVLVYGCSDPKEPNEKNFSMAIEDYYAKTDKYCFGKRIKEEIHGDLPHYEALSSIGLLKIIRKGRKWGNRFAIFDLTDKGKRVYVPNRGFCYGTLSVSNIVNYTEPQNLFGRKIVRVKYKYKLVDIPDWALSLAADNNHKDYILSLMKSQINSQNEATDTLMLTGKGWVHEKLL